MDVKQQENMKVITPESLGLHSTATIFPPSYATQETIFEYDETIYDFHGIIRRLFGIDQNAELGELHVHDEAVEAGRPYRSKHNTLFRRMLMAKVKTKSNDETKGASSQQQQEEDKQSQFFRGLREEWEDTMHRFVREVIILHTLTLFLNI